MHGTSITSILHRLANHTKPLPTLLQSSSFSTSLQTLTDSHTKPLQPRIDSPRKPLSNPLYTFLPRTHNPNNIVNLICNNLKHNNGQTTSLYTDIQWVLPYLGHDEISKVLLRCQSQPFTSLRFFNWVRNDLGIRPTVHNYCIIVHILTWSREFALAMKFVSELIELSSEGQLSEDVFRSLVLCTEGCNWSPVVFDLLIKGYVKAGCVGDSLRVFKKMIKMGIVPDVSACNCLLNGLLKSDRIDWCWRIYDEMGRVGVSSNLYTFNILTHVLCRDGDVGKVNEFLEKMEEEGFDPDIVTYNTLIGSYCRKGRLADAFYLYKIMYRRYVVPDLVTYTSLMKALHNSGKLKEAHQLFHRMVDRGLSPDVRAYNSLIDGYCKEGKMQEARSLLKEGIWRGLSPNGFTCRLLVNGLKGAFLLKDMMVDNGLTLDFATYKALIGYLCKSCKSVEGESLMRQMVEADHVPDAAICRALVNGYCVERNLELTKLKEFRGLSINF